MAEKLKDQHLHLVYQLRIPKISKFYFELTLNIIFKI